MTYVSKSGHCVWWKVGMALLLEGIHLQICPGQFCLLNGMERLNNKNRLWLVSVYLIMVCVFLSVCVCWDNGIIEVRGVTGALMPGLPDWG